MSTPAQNRPAPPPPPALEVPADLKTEYANVVRIAHSPSELVFDFAHLLPGVTPARVCAGSHVSPWRQAAAEGVGRKPIALRNCVRGDKNPG